MPLMVIVDFDGRRRGEIITEAGTVANILASPHAACVVRVARPSDDVAVADDPPASEPAPPPSDIVED